MANFKLNHSIDSSGLNTKLKKLIKNTNLTVPMDAIGADMRTQTQLNFRKEETPDGNDWKKHAPSTTKIYKAQGRSNSKILQRRTYLRKSVNIYTSTKNTASISSNLKYAPTHQYGDNRTTVSYTHLTLPTNREV